ncbi:MAG TPA: OmpH family outer membrane protein [Thermoanaerobaculia bacterium]|nr:OmpH family outer membrane protein [Thermoanaerobaculia bacterium]
MPLIGHSGKTATGVVVLGLALALALLAVLAPLPAMAAPAAGAGSASPAAAPAGGAGPTAGLRVAVIDTEKILLSSVAGKKAIAELKKAQEQKEGELRSKQQEIKELQDKLSQGRLTLAQDKLAEMSKQLEDREIALRRLSDDATRELNKRKDDLLGGIDEKVMPVINQIGHEQGYTMIFRKFESGLIYADDAIDITSAVVQRLDAQAQK